MPTPTVRTPVRVARGTYSNLNSSVSDIQEGEICYATDQDILYVKEGSSLVNASHMDITHKADLASPTFTGVPAAPTASGGTNTTQIATTAFVTAAVPDISGKADTSAVNTSLAAKADLASPTFTGTPVAPTASSSTNTTQIATTAFVTGAISDLSDSAPATLNTLNELAAALGDDASFSTTVTNNIASKAALAGASFTGDVTMGEALSIERVKENVAIVGVALTGAVTFDVKTNGSVIYYTPDATGNYAVDVRGDGSTTLDSLMSQGEVLTVVFITGYGTTPYYMTGLTVDGAAATVRWIGGAPSSAGTASSICANHISIIKTGSATFTVLISKSEYIA